MNYYEKLVNQIGKTMKAHPRSTIMMDSGNFKIIAKGKNSQTVSRMLHASPAKPHGVPVVFRKPQTKAVWIL